MEEEEVEAITNEWPNEWCRIVPEAQIVDEDLHHEKPPSQDKQGKEGNPQEDA